MFSKSIKISESMFLLDDVGIPIYARYLIRNIDCLDAYRCDIAETISVINVK